MSEEMTGLLQDLRYAARQLRKTPLVTLTAAAMLAVGIGVNTIIFSVCYQVLLRTLPVRKPDQLVVLKESSKYETGQLDVWGGDPAMVFPYPAFQALRDGSQSIAELAVATAAPATIVSSKNTDKALMQLVSGNYFTLLGVKPVLGRLIVSDDDVFHAGRAVAVVSDTYWGSHFGTDSSLLNQQIEINGSPFTVVGVVPSVGLIDSAQPAVFLPISQTQSVVPGKQDILSDPLERNLNIFGRLALGVTRRQAEARLNTIWWNWRRDAFEAKKENILDREGWLQTHLSVLDGARGIPLLQRTLGKPLTALGTIAFLVFLIACANVASLLLAKGVTRSREFAVHAALGGGRKRILQKLISESLLLAASGVALGLLLASLALRLLMGLVPATNTLRGAVTSQLGWTTIEVCVTSAIVISLIFSIAPAIVSSRINLLSALHQQTEPASGAGTRLRSLLVAGEISLSLVSLSGAAVFGWSLHELRNVNPGYDTSRHTLTFRVDASMLGKSDSQVKNEYSNITSAIQQQPGVRSVAYAAEGLIDDSELGSNITVAGYSENEGEPTPDENWITPNFFSTTKVPLIAGRIFTEQDTASSPKVAIVDEAFVKHYFAGSVERALSGRFGFGGGNRVKLDFQIVGIVPTVRANRIAVPPAVPFIYLPYDQTYSATEPDPRNHAATFYTNTSGDASGLAGSVRAIVHAIDRNLPVTRLETMEDHLNGVIFENRLASTLSIAMSGIGLALAAIGLYGLLAFVVAQRTREIGIRMALGAAREHILALIVRRLAAIVCGGVSGGVFLEWISVHLLTSRDSTLSHTPIWLFSASTFLLVLVMFLAAWIPTNRAAKVDPMVALRYE